MPKILVVDDEPSILCVLSNLLQAEKYSVTATLRGDKAVELLKSDEAFDLLLSDVRMNPVTGMQLLDVARDIRPDLPVILLTAYYHRDTAADALEKGAFAYMSKPWNTEELLMNIERAIESKKKESST
jgi:DNA-binding NtrC family response regulator